MTGVWKEQGYEAFADGTFGNGGQNLYVSRSGVLQRIFRYDLNRDGYTDVMFVNSQDMGERPDAHVYDDPLNSPDKTALLTAGAYWGAMDDLNGDGYDDLVIAHQHNGTHTDVTAYIYYGSPEGISERNRIELPAPNSRAVAIGDFNGDGKPDIAFASNGKLMIYYQTELGFRYDHRVVLDLEATHLAAGDLDRDGYADLYIRLHDGRSLVLWGTAAGISSGMCTQVGDDEPAAAGATGTSSGRMMFAEGWLPKIVSIGGTMHLFRREAGGARFYPVRQHRTLGEPIIIDCPHVVSADAAAVRGSPYSDLVLAVCHDRNEREHSWIYWGSEDGYAHENRQALPTTSARDVCLRDVDGDGMVEIIFVQGRTDTRYTTESIIYRTAAGGIAGDPVRLVTHDATTALVGRTSDAALPQLVIINHESGGVQGDVSAYAYLGGPDGFDPARRLAFPGWAAVDAICCDFNDDGWGDVLLANCAENAPRLDPGSFLYWGGANGFHPDRKLVVPTLRAHGVAVGDFRRCGYLDIAVAGANNPELLLFRGGAGGWDLDHPQKIMMDPGLTEYVPIKEYNTYDDPNTLAYKEPRWLLAADFNNDGWLDLFVSQIWGDCFILWGGPEGYSMERITRLNCDGGICAQAADLTGNGWLDLVIGGHLSKGKTAVYESYIYIYWGGPDGYREDRRAQLPAHCANSLTIADFNRDGILDIFATAYNAGRERDVDAYMYWGQPGGVYSFSHHSRIFTHSSCGAMAIDFNEDGWVDLAIANHKAYGNHNANSFVLWNGPDGFSEKNVTLLPTHGPHGMMSVDAGNIMDRSSEEYYISSVKLLEPGAQVRNISWKAEIQPKTWVKAQIRTACSEAELEQSPWQGPDGAPESWFENGRMSAALPSRGPWIQYRLALGAVNGGNSPRVTEVCVEYNIRNV